MLIRLALSAILPVTLAATLASSALAQNAPAFTAANIEGYLCCNMRSDGKWISDDSYPESGRSIIPLGTTAKITGYGRYRMYAELHGVPQAIGNDYSRDVNMTTFSLRYVVPENPKLKLASYPAKIRDAILAAKVTPGMTREQLFMAVGYPIANENPDIDAKTLVFWPYSESQFRVAFDDNDQVKEITVNPLLRNRIVLE